VHKRIISAVKRVDFVSDRMSYIIIRCRWCHVIALNVHAPTEDKTDDVKDSFCEELERAFDKFPKYHTKILLGDFNAKVGREDIFKPTIRNESLHNISNNNGVRLVILPHLKTPESKVRCSHIVTYILVNILECLQMGNPTIRLTIFW
jgi:exonuclease III